MEDCKMLLYQVIECSTDFKPCKKCKLPKLHLKYALTSVAVATMIVSACKDLTLGYVLSLENSCSCHYLYKCFGIDNNHSKPHPENPSQSILWSVTTNSRTSACDSWPFNRVFSPSTCARRCRSPNTSAVLAWAEVTMVAEFLKEPTGQIGKSPDALPQAWAGVLAPRHCIYGEPGRHWIIHAIAVASSQRGNKLKWYQNYSKLPATCCIPMKSTEQPNWPLVFLHAPCVPYAPPHEGQNQLSTFCQRANHPSHDSAAHMRFLPGQSRIGVGLCSPS